jgi:hypothetical protein
MGNNIIPVCTVQVQKRRVCSNCRVNNTTNWRQFKQGVNVFKAMPKENPRCLILDMNIFKIVVKPFNFQEILYNRRHYGISLALCSYRHTTRAEGVKGRNVPQISFFISCASGYDETILLNYSNKDEVYSTYQIGFMTTSCWLFINLDNQHV